MAHSILTKYHNPLSCILHFLKVRYTEDYCSKLYNEHPYKYSLFGLVSMLSDYRVTSKGLKLNDKEEILKIESPFIAHVQHSFVVVFKIAEGQVHYLWLDKEISLDLDEFYSLWSGIVLLVERNEDSIEPDYKLHLIKESYHKILQYSFILLVMTISVYLFFINNTYKSISLSLLLIINIIGLSIGYLLLLKQTKTQSKYADAVCSFLKKGDCNNILESSASKLFGIISWSEVGFSYFISNIVILIAVPSLISYLALINICVLPYTLWSVWFQKFRAKQWCPLCLSVQLILWLIFSDNLVTGVLSEFEIDLNNIFLCIIIYAFPYVVTDLILPKISEAKRSIRTRQEINSLKMKDEVFLALLKEEAHYKVNKETSSILFGNKNAKNLITILSNPHCNPCASMHKRVEKMVELYKHEICIQYIFTAFDKELEISNKFLIAVYLNRAYDEVKSIYEEWYRSKKYDSDNYIKGFNMNLEADNIAREFYNHQVWIKETKLVATPTILFNGYEIPICYQLEDMKYFMNLNVDFK